MSQEYTEDKELSLEPLSSGRRLLEALLIVVALFAVYLMVALVSFNPSDPSWSQTAWHEPIHNLGGGVGAWLADTLFFIFGVMAYAIPPVIIGLCWITFRQRHSQDYIDYFAVALRLIGVIALVVTSCGLAALNADDIWYFASGGVIGSLLGNAMSPWFSGPGGTLTLLCIWAAGLTLYTGWSWLTIAEKIGGVVMGVLTFASNRSRADEEWHEDEDDQHDAPAPARTKRAQNDEDVLLARNAPRVGAADSDDDDADPLLAKTVPVVDDVTTAAGNDDATSVATAAVNAPNITASPQAVAPPPQSETAVTAPAATETFVAQVQPAAVPSASQPPLYHFELPEDAVTPPSVVPAVPEQDDDGPQMGNWREASAVASENVARHLSSASVAAPAAAAAFSTAVQSTADSMPFMPGFTATSGDDLNPQVKQGIGPELPRPNPVKLPTRRELASYGIKLPSQRMAEEKAKEEELRQQQNSTAAEQESLSPQQSEEAEEAQLREAFMAQQQQRYGEEFSADDEEALQQASLARQFADQQQQRYAGESDHDSQNGANTLSHTPAQDAAFSAGAGVQPFAPVSPVAAEQPAAPPVNSAPAWQQPAAPQAPQSAWQPAEQPAAPPVNSAPAWQQPAAPQAPQSAWQPAEQPAAPPVNSAPAWQQPAAPQAPQSAWQPAEQPAAPPVNSAPAWQQPAAPQAPQSAWQPAEQPAAPPVNSAPAWQQPAAPQAPQPAWQPAEQPAAPPVNSAPAWQQPAAPQAPQPAWQPAEQPAAPEPAMDSLIHPFLMRHEQPTHKPTTPLPTLDLLASPPAEKAPVDQFALEQTSRLIEARLADYRVKAEVVGNSPGPVITRYELDLAPGVKAARISNLSRDLARSLSAVAVRVVEVIPGRPYVGLELPNLHRQTVYLREVLDCPEFQDNPSPLSIVLGKDISGDPVVADLGKMPHLLVAGTTGSGKSVGVNAMILSILYKATPKEVRFIMIDPKMLELSVYEGIPHLLTDVVTDMKDAANALRWCVVEMERRYKLMSALGVRNLAGYNEKVDMAEAMGRPIPDPFWKPTDSMDMTPPVLEKEPYIVVMVDEFADLIMTVGKKVEELIARLAQKARAAGIHLVLATQRPSVDVITGLIKANIPTRIAFTVSSKIDSRTILDQAGAESLLGMGDMLYLAPNSSIPVRVHGAFVRDQEVHAVVKDWKARGRPQYKEGILSGGEDSESSSGGVEGDEELDQLFDQAVEFVVDKRRASISGVQRQFRIGYNRAARIIEQMEVQGIVSSPGHNGNREVLAPPPHEM